MDTFGDLYLSKTSQKISKNILKQLYCESHGISPNTKPTRLFAEFAKFRRYSARLSVIIVLLFNTLTTKHRSIAEKLGRSSFVKKKPVTFHRARTCMNESGSFV